MSGKRPQIPAPERVEQSREATAVDEARAKRPKRTIKNAPKVQAYTAANTTAFEATGGVKRLVLKVGLLPAGVSSKDDELTEDALRILGSRYIHFSNGLYVSTEPKVTAWLRHRLKAGIARSYRERVPQPSAAVVGDETVMFSPTGERLMTYDQFVAAQQRMATPEVAAAEVTVGDFSLARPEEDAERAERLAASREGAAQKGPNTA